MSDPEELRNTAQHEAAHAVLAHSMGGYVHQISLPTQFTRVVWRARRGQDRPDLWDQRRLIAILAGYTASMLVLSSVWEKDGIAAGVCQDHTLRFLGEQSELNPGNDLSIAAGQLSELFGEDVVAAREFLQESAESAEHGVRELWPAISAVAEAALRSDGGVLDRDAFFSAIQPWVESDGLPIRSEHPAIQQALEEL